MKNYKYFSNQLVFMSNYKLSNIYKILPYKLSNRVNRTELGRGGKGIYNRRVRRSYRVLIQYDFWKDLINTEEGKDILNTYEEGYVVMIKPEEYFGDNHPHPSPDLDSNFKLGKTGFVYYSVISEHEDYKPLEEQWEHVYELSSKGKQENDDTWVGEYVLNVRNGGDSLRSRICDNNRPSEETKEVKEYIKDKFNLDVSKSIPIQAGLGNYDYDYANPETIENVKYQMLYLVLTCKSHNGETCAQYIRRNYRDIKHKEDKNKEEFLTLMNSPEEEYVIRFNEEFKLFEEECERRGLIDFDELSSLGVWDSEKKQLICPLCHEPLYIDEFFDDIKQMKGRRVADNTQTAIVLMHIKALTSGKFRHRPYNLGWGHNYCNLIQGNDDISETIKKLKKIIESHESL